MYNSVDKYEVVLHTYSQCLHYLHTIFAESLLHSNFINCYNYPSIAYGYFQLRPRVVYPYIPSFLSKFPYKNPPIKCILSYTYARKI